MDEVNLGGSMRPKLIFGKGIGRYGGAACLKRPHEMYEPVGGGEAALGCCTLLEVDLLLHGSVCFCLADG